MIVFARDAGAEGWRALALRERRGQWQVALSATGSNAEELAKFSAGAAAALGSEAASRVVLLLRRSDYSVLRLILPQATGDEVRAMLAYRLGSMLPLDLEDSAWMWERAPEADGPLAPPAPTQVVDVAWTSLKRVESQVAFCRQAGLDVRAVLPTLLVVRAGLAQPEEEHRLLLLDGRNAEWLEWAQSVAVPAPDGQSASPGMLPPPAGRARPQSEVAKILTETRDEEGGPIEVWPVAEERLVDGARAGHGPARPVPWSEAVRNAFPGLTQAGSEDAADLPLALAGWRWAETPTAGMLPAALVSNRQSESRQRLLIQVAILALLLLLLVAGNGAVYRKSLERQRDDSQTQIARLSGRAKSVEAVRERIEAINEQLEYEIPPLEVLAALQETLRANDRELEGLFLDSLNWEEGGQTVIEGHSLNDITPWRFAEALNAKGTLRVVGSPRLQFRQYGDTRSIRFTMTLLPAKARSQQTP
ncbi:MAG: hypothetical protein RLY93_02895 [Sumerlaeia bacterium]